MDKTPANQKIADPSDLDTCGQTRAIGLGFNLLTSDRDHCSV